MQHTWASSGIKVTSFYFQRFHMISKIIIQYIFINVAHASNISEMHLVINRTRIPIETVVELPREPENPYIFKPKSYSSRRSMHPEIAEKQLRSSPSKRVKKQITKNKESAFDLRCDLESVKNLIQEQVSKSFFDETFFTKSKTESDKGSETIIHEQAAQSKKLNPMMKNQITIVSNKNEKIQVFIHQGLLLSNTSHAKVGKDQHFLKDVSNPFDFEKRNFYLKNIKFEKDYKSGYAPIEMQQNNVEENDVVIPDASKTHFIRKKQSTLSLPRACGVSYIKPTQSNQSFPFDPLPPLIFQCSSRCQLTGNKYQELFNSFNLYSQTAWLPFISTTEEDMRQLLLGKKIGNVGWVNGIENLWPLFGESTFFLVLYSIEPCLTESDIWKAFGECPFKVGILVKKSTSGKKAFLKSLNIKQISNEEEAKQEKMSDLNEKDTILQNSLNKSITKQEQSKSLSLQESLAHELKDCRTVITLSLRLQMYVEEKQWKNADKQNKDMLNYLITNLKDSLQKNLLNVIKKRFTMSKECQNSLFQQQVISKLRVANDKESNFDGLKLKQSDIQLNEPELKSLFKQHYENKKKFQVLLLSSTKNMSLELVHKINKSEAGWQKNLKMPLYYISTRDSFAFDLVQKITLHKRGDKTYKKIQYYFEADNLPTNYGKQYKQKFPNLDVGVTCYHDYFTNQELLYFEKNTFETEKNAFKNKFLQMTVQPSIVGSKIKRTKFFFGYRYMWTRCQIAEPGSYVGAGVRRDVTEPPKWTDTIVNQLVKGQIAEKDFINSIAINVYHDGKQGLAQHFDDAVRFKQPIYTLRLFSDARLSFGSQFYGFCNGAFIIPLPRGCICVMQESSYAANGVKHCVRPCDMTGKSCAVILRQMHHKVVNQAKKYDQLIDFPAWVSCMSSSPQAVTFAEQKRREAQYELNNNTIKDETEK